jgi:hypothetical protein
MSLFNFLEILEKKQAGRFFRFFLVLLIGGIALGSVIHTDQKRYTFVFFGMKDRIPRMEERMVPRTRDRESEIRRYAEETLLGPQNPASALLFPRETKLLSFLYQEKTVYINLSEHAAMPIFFDGAPDNEALTRTFTAFRESLMRNFSFIKEIKFFIEGHILDF